MKMKMKKIKKGVLLVNPGSQIALVQRMSKNTLENF